MVKALSALDSINICRGSTSSPWARLRSGGKNSIFDLLANSRPQYVPNPLHGKPPVETIRPTSAAVLRQHISVGAPGQLSTPPYPAKPLSELLVAPQAAIAVVSGRRYLLRREALPQLDTTHIDFPHAFYVAQCDRCAVKLVAQLFRVLHPR